MAVLEIPTSTELALYDQEVELDAAVFAMRFAFNAREGFWYLDLDDADGNPIRSGIKLVISTPLLRLVTGETRPPGEMLVLDTTSTDTEAGLGDLGADALLLYQEAV